MNNEKLWKLEKQFTILPFITSILNSLVILSTSLALIGSICSRNTPFFALNRFFFPASEKASLKYYYQSDFKAFLK